MPTFDLGRPLWIGRLATCACEGMAAGTLEGATHGGGSPELRRRRRPGATMHQNTCGLDREEEENGAKLTRGLLTAVERCKRRATKRGGRDHGRSPGRGLWPRLRAPGRRGGVLVVLCVRGRERGLRESRKTQRWRPWLFTSAAAAGTTARFSGEGGAPGVGFLCERRSCRSEMRRHRGLIHRRRGVPDGRQWCGGRLHGGGACAKVERCGACTGAEKGA
jgi:hypothetical protein